MWRRPLWAPYHFHSIKVISYADFHSVPLRTHRSDEMELFLCLLRRLIHFSLCLLTAVSFIFIVLTQRRAWDGAAETKWSFSVSFCCCSFFFVWGVVDKYLHSLLFLLRNWMELYLFFLLLVYGLSLFIALENHNNNFIFSSPSISIPSAFFPTVDALRASTRPTYPLDSTLSSLASDMYVLLSIVWEKSYRWKLYRITEHSTSNGIFIICWVLKVESVENSTKRQAQVEGENWKSMSRKIVYQIQRKKRAKSDKNCFFV